MHKNLHWPFPILCFLKHVNAGRTLRVILTHSMCIPHKMCSFCDQFTFVARVSEGDCFFSAEDLLNGISLLFPNLEQVFIKIVRMKSISSINESETEGTFTSEAYSNIGHFI